jgi:hypothetical protein
MKVEILVDDTKFSVETNYDNFDMIRKIVADYISTSMSFIEKENKFLVSVSIKEEA